MPGKNKKKSKKNNETDEHKTQEDEAEKLLKLQQEEERKKQWIESWNRKIEEEERLEDCKACCAPDEYFRKPKTQENIWIQVNHEKNTQQVEMTFKTVPVPKPNPPPLPRLKIDFHEDKKKNDSKPITDEKRQSKKKKK